MPVATLTGTPIILASASPRRAALLRDAGIPFVVQVSPAPEPERKPRDIPTELWPMCLAYIKATAVQQKIENRQSKVKNPLILGADTIVVTPDNTILNKAPHRAAARKMLLSLHGKTHRVITGIALLQGDRVRLASAVAACYVRKFSESTLEAYLDSGLWKGKAGAYGIQDETHDPFVILRSGEFSTVVGLPVQLVQSELSTFRED